MHDKPSAAVKQVGNGYRPALEAGVVDKLPAISGTATKVYLALLFRSDRETRTCYPSLGYLAAAVGSSRRTVIRALDELLRAGMIARSKRRTKHGDSNTNLYRILQLSPCPGSVMDDTTPAQSGSVTDDTTGCQGCHQGSDMDDTGVVSRMAPGTTTNQQLPPNKPRTSREIGSAEAELPAELNTPEFRRAWADWERHRREIRKRLTSGTRRRQLAQCSAWGAHRAVQAIEASITHGWTGLFDPNDKVKTSGKCSTNRGPMGDSPARNRTRDWSNIRIEGTSPIPCGSSPSCAAADRAVASDGAP